MLKQSSYKPTAELRQTKFLNAFLKLKTSWGFLFLYWGEGGSTASHSALQPGNIQISGHPPLISYET